MNVQDVVAEAAGGDRLEAIFERQRGLMAKYREIEDRNGLLEYRGAPPYDLDDAGAQARLKNMAWRVTEEIAEALDAELIHPGTEHPWEELADALHFFVELLICVGLEPKVIVNEWMVKHSVTGDLLDAAMRAAPQGVKDLSNIYGFAMQAVKDLGMAMNCLKNKPWKQTHMVTDKAKFRSHVMDGFSSFFGLCKTMGMTPDDLWGLYFRKSKVNEFRQRSNY